MRLLTPFRQARARFALGLLAALAAACKPANDALAPPRPEFPLASNGLRRLTYNSSADVSPAWTPDGQAISYVAEALPPVVGEWLRAQVPAEGGTAVRELPAYHLPPSLELLPVLRDSTGARAILGYMEKDEHSCPCNLETTPSVRAITVAVLQTGAPPPPLEQLPQLRLPLVGAYQQLDTFPVPGGGPRPLVRIAFIPALARRRDDIAAAFGPSWSPEGTRIALTNGDALYLWTVGDSAAAAVPGVADAAFPRWSPDGQWIAFTRYPRDSVVIRTCRYDFNPFQFCFADQHVYSTRAPAVWVVHPDGSGLVRVTDGEESAWTPGSDALVIRRPTGLVLVSLATGATSPVANTAGATEPAVSPDGRRIVFVSRAGGSLDLWTLEWPAPPAVVSR